MKISVKHNPYEIEPRPVALGGGWRRQQKITRNIGGKDLDLRRPMTTASNELTRRNITYPPDYGRLLTKECAWTILTL